MKKFAGYIIILHMCTKNHSHIRYGFQDQSETDKIFYNFGAFFALLPPPPPPDDPENQNFEKKKKEKNAWRYYPFIHSCVPYMEII